MSGLVEQLPVEQADLTATGAVDSKLWGAWARDPACLV